MPVEILMVEDNKGDIVLIGEAMAKAGLAHRLNVVRDGMQAMEYLQRQGPYAQAAPPGLIVLDLKLPRRSGREVLDEIRGDPVLCRIPLVLLSSSRAELDAAKSGGRPLECDMVKPSTFAGYVEMVQAIETFRQTAGGKEP